MNFELKTGGAQKAAADAVVLLVAESTAKTSLPKWVQAAIQAKDFTAKVGKLLSAYAAPEFTAKHVVVVGTGEGSAKDIRTAVAAAFGALKAAAPKSVAVDLSLLGKDPQVAAAMQALADASYSYTTSKPSATARSVAKVVMHAADSKVAQKEFEIAKAVISGVEFAKEWANRPGNHATPTLLAKAAQSLATKTSGLTCEVLGPKEVAKLKMGSFMSVAQGSEEPLRFIVLRYNGGAAKQAPIVLVGKGITFDTGGISIKPAGEMDEMKFDMGGAASVLGTFKALAELKPKLNVVGLIPACENMPDGRAIKPGDVVTSMSGQTIEILNTDAEGRLILCDALTYAERFKPKAVVDIATLTGACVIALGAVRHGMYASTDALAAQLAAAGDASGDLCWRMPLDDEYAEGLKSNFADVGNVAGRAGGSITAAKFLQRFTAKYDWAHLDVAGTAWKGGAAKGSTGRPVPLLVSYLLAQV